MKPITADTAGQLALGMAARCSLITRTAWANEGQSLIVAHGNGLSVWMGGFDAHPDHVFATEAPLRALAVSPLGPLAAVGGHDGRIRLWNTETWQRDQAMPVQLHKGAVTALAFHPTRPIVASGDAFGAVIQVDLDSGRFMKLTRHAKEVTSVAWSADGAQLASGSWDGTVQVSSAVTGALEQTLIHEDWVRGLAFHPSGAQVVTACRDGNLRAWSAEDGRLLSVIPAHTGGVDALTLSPDGALIASGGRDGALRLWHAETLIPAAVIDDAHAKPLLTLAFRPQGDFLISGGGDNWLRLWEIPASGDAPASD